MLIKLLSLALAGAAGTLARYAIQYPFQHWTEKATGWSFPWGTLPVNALGCFLFGFVWALADANVNDKAVISGEARLIILVGFLGAFTTFSTFGFETGELLRAHRYAAATLNVILQNGVGIALAIAGIKLGGLLATRLLGT